MLKEYATLQKWMKPAVAVVTLGAATAVYLYGFLSGIPYSLWTVVDASFAVNHFFTLSITLSFSFFLSYWVLDVVRFLSYHLEPVVKERNLVTIAALLRAIWQDALGPPLLRKVYTGAFGAVIFCYTFLGLDFVRVAFTMLLAAVGFQFFLEFTDIGATPEQRKSGFWKSFKEYVTYRKWDVTDLDWATPMLVFFALYMSNLAGEHRATKLLDQTPAYFPSIERHGVILFTTSAGVLIAVEPTDGDLQTGKPVYSFVTYAGAEMLRTSQ